MRVSSAELYRKTIHTALGLAVALTPGIISLPALLTTLILFTFAILLSRHPIFEKTLRRVDRYTWGEVLFPLGLLLSASLFFTGAPLAFQFGALVLALADSGAALVGEQYGRKKLSETASRKTWFGSATFFLITLALSVTFLWQTGHSMTGNISVSVGIAALLTIIEAITGYGLDNFFIPTLASFLLFLVL